MRKYSDILEHADAWFREVMETQPENLQCGRGCSLCCHGLFEIGAGDLAVLAEGLEVLHPARRAAVIRRATAIVEDYDHPDLRECTDKEKEAFFERTSNVPCPALSPAGECLMYGSRPLVCRTFGLPIRDGKHYIGDICELNFTTAPDIEKQTAAWDLQWEDVAGSDEEYTVAEAIVMVARMRGWGDGGRGGC